jgi:hypothetical protein
MILIMAGASRASQEIFQEIVVANPRGVNRLFIKIILSYSRFRILPKLKPGLKIAMPLTVWSLLK